MKKNLLLLLAIVFASSLWAQKMTREQYIQKYHRCAIEKMNAYGIPASITLAQGLLESDNGNSILAREGNNHFGIKCAGGWTGETILKDDDHKNDCFRKYASVSDSYDDHSAFLMGKDRYKFLFSYSKTDYVSWARGLKRAGYATNPQYANQLIKIIEDNNLQRFDKGYTLPGYAECMNGNTSSKESNTYTAAASRKTKRAVKRNNGVPYIIVQQGDSYKGITAEFGLKDWELITYNELPENQEPATGTILYIKSKRNKAARGSEVHTVRENEDLWQISQIYGVKLSKLRKYNNLKAYDMVKLGDKINLRRKK